MPKSRSQFSHRPHHEGSLVGAGVGNDEIWQVDASIPVEEQIEVDRAGSPARRVGAAIATEPPLDLLQSAQEIERRQPAAKLERRVQISPLAERPDRRGLEDGRGREHKQVRLPVERPDDRRKGRLAIPEIRADRDIDDLSTDSHTHPRLLSPPAADPR